MLAQACSPNGSAILSAPMVSADASTEAISLVQKPEAPAGSDRVAIPFAEGDRWVGHYNCAQGRTELALVFEHVGLVEVGVPPRYSEKEDSRGEKEEPFVSVAVLFEFAFDGHGMTGFASATGTARMAGHYEPKSRRMILRGETWVDQPKNYNLVNLVGLINNSTKTYSGTVEGPGCTTFFASPEKTGAAPTHPLSPRSLPRPRP